MILPPPDFPLPFDVIANLILYQFKPSEMPWVGFSSRLPIRIAKSAFREGYFLESFLISF